ncbi:MAG: trypsin-like peptidase domain-containing protein [Planctomycetota bacterium]
MTEAEDLQPPPPPGTNDRLIAIRTIVIGIVLMWVILVAGWAVRRGIESRAGEQRREEVREARLRLASVNELQGVFNEVNAVMEPAVVKIDVIRPPNSVVGSDTPASNSGSGVIVAVIEDEGERLPIGHIITNEHVVRGHSDIAVTLSDGRRLDARVIGEDQQSDLAVVEVRAIGLVPADWGDSDLLQKGDWVLAFGSPFGFVGSMTAGVVSALNRTQGELILSPLGEPTFQDFIQVDAAINPGNSGGPLVDVAGRVVGINTAIFSRSGSFSGVGFAIPSNQAKRFYEDIRDRGRVVRGWLGIRGAALSEYDNAYRRLGLEDDRGVLVGRVFRGTPAAEADLRRGDVITEIDGRRVDDFSELILIVGFAEPGEAIDLTVVRDAAEEQVSVVIEERPRGSLDFNLEPMGGDLYGLRFEDRVNGPPMVVAVEPGSPANRAGIRAGDQIFAIGGRPVGSARQAMTALDGVPPQVGVIVRVASGNRVFAVFLGGVVRDEEPGDLLLPGR